ncbi:MOSC domain-containing protein [Dactylosporangium sp. AC04546]|uniref:MOSC domain-containing protein n=1 Tax=Dactylosporangium sp. AC04546 TaxID=2862460 RepID=UPI001EDE01CF|nr:MOSC N-terminal beta barrel domain-containing protein [Dactylosporangium sp. AC04546]WVK88030.1 MOSC domain-containing protein [Dactylosporangium sp. AC04546]
MGEIVWLGRYPVKSMLGEELSEVALEADGLVGDRRYALVDRETGLVASAKNPRKWGWLLQHSARYEEDGTVTISEMSEMVDLVSEVPEGATLERLTPETEPGAGEMTRNVLPRRTFVDFAPVHVVTTATLDALRADHRRFRPNIVVRMVDGEPFAENDWPGKRIAIGSAEIEAVVPTPRCVIPTLAHGDLPADPSVIRTAARQNRVQVFDLGKLTCVGAYATVSRPGTLRVGDLVHIDGASNVGAV